ncbi:hypothetical protein [Oscillatoria sp. FACHB-1407]|nr:hypothetical protein [Oscillatoria sp. FACHB-1407]
MPEDQPPILSTAKAIVLQSPPSLLFSHKAQWNRDRLAICGGI